MNISHLWCLVYVLRVSVQRLPSRAMLLVVGVGWKNDRDSQIKTWHKSMKKMTTEINWIGADLSVRICGISVTNCWRLCYMALNCSRPHNLTHIFSSLRIWMCNFTFGRIVHPIFPRHFPSYFTVYATTAASPTESSYATFCDDPKIAACLADLYSYDWIVDSQTVCSIQICIYIYLTYLIQYQITLDI